MKKIILLLLLIIPLKINALNYPELHYDKAIIYDMTDNNILYEKNSKEETSVASLTKIMTTITAIENINNLEDKITFTSNMKSLVRYDASIAGLKIGESYTYKDLLYASILPSGADATIALAIATSGSIDSFVNQMNELAINLDMKNTHFVNVTGLDAKGHYSTAEDILKLLKYALNNKQFKEIYTTKEYTLSNNQKVKSTISSYNKNNNIDLSRILGSKTGFTKEAGSCISVYFNSNNHELILITLGAIKDQNNYNLKDALELIDFIDDNYHNQTLIDKNTEIRTLEVTNSNIDTYTIKPNKIITKYLEDDYNKSNFKIEYEGLETLSFLNKKGTKIGTIKYYYQEELLKKEDVFLDTNISISISKIIKNNINLIVIIIIFIIGLISLNKKIIKRL